MSVCVKNRIIVRYIRSGMRWHDNPTLIINGSAKWELNSGAEGSVLIGIYVGINIMQQTLYNDDYKFLTDGQTDSKVPLSIVSDSFRSSDSFKAARFKAFFQTFYWYVLHRRL